MKALPFALVLATATVGLPEAAPRTVPSYGRAATRAQTVTCGKR